MQVTLIRSFHGLLATWFACGTLCSGAVDIAGGLLIDLDASDFKLGAEKWRQHSRGTGITGDFLAKGTPTRQTIAGAPAVVFDGDGDYFVGPITTAALHAPGAKHSVEVWVFQGNVRDQESVVSWGKRQGPDLTFAGFRYGADPDFGAIARWGSSESAFTTVPPPGHWHHIAYTYDGSQQAVYVDGKLDNSKAVGLLDAHDMLPIHIGAELGGDLKLEGQFTHFSGALAKVRIHSGALDAAQVKHNYEEERDGFPGLVAKRLQQSPMHRFSFNSPAGAAPDGSTVTDSIGGLTAVIRGAGATFTGTSVQLPGGSSASQAYVDLPNGLISSRESLSIEFWETQSGPQSWCRILSIGTNSAGEVTGPGGVFNGTESLTLFGNVGATQVNRFARSYGTFPNGGPDRNPAEYPDSDYGVEFHQVITYDKVLKEWHWYRNGVLMEVIADTEGPTTMDDVNVWLGRSEFSSDNNFRGLYNEFRVYNHTLSEDEIYGNFLAGPDKLNLGGDLMAMNWTPEDPGVHSFANTGGTNNWSTGANGPHPDGPGSIATFASDLSGDQEIGIDRPLTLGSVNLGTRSRGGAFTLRAGKAGALTMDSGNGIPASITQLPGSPGNFISAPLLLRSDTEVTNQSANPLLLTGSIGGGGAFIKGGNGPVILTGDGAAHGGEVKIVAGDLVFGDSGKTGMLGASRFSITDPGQLVINRSDDVELGGSFCGSGRISHLGRGKLTLPQNGSLANGGIIQMAHGSGPFTSDGKIEGSISLRTDSKMVLKGHSETRIIEWLSVGTESGGDLTIQDSAKVEILGRGDLNIGDTGTGQSLITLKSGSVLCREMFVGKGPVASGILFQSGGEIKKVRKDAFLDSRIGGGGPGAWQVWGYWRMTGGTYDDDWNLQVGAYGIGVMEVDGGIVNVDGFLGIGRYEDEEKHPAHGVLDVKSGTVNTTAVERLLLVGEEGFGVLNIRGRGQVNCINRMIIGAGSINKPGEGTVNLLAGGTLSTSAISQFNQTEAIGRLNFDGGTLKARIPNETFFEGIDAAYVRKGGAVIDSNDCDVRINQPLVAPRGNGVVTIPVTNGGSGYLGPPLIDISGGAGSGATALADLVDGSVKSVTITHAGVDYLSAPTVSVLGGGSGTGLTLGTPVLGQNVSGGLVKTGGGSLTLGGENTYTGPTTVKQGTLWVDGQIAGGVEVAAGASFGGNGAIAGTVDMAPGSTLSLKAGTGLTVRGNMNVRGAVHLEAAGTPVGRMEVAGTLDLTGARLALKSGSFQPGSPVQLVAGYGKLRGKFGGEDSLPPGYSLDYHYNGHNQIVLIATAAHPNGE